MKYSKNRGFKMRKTVLVLTLTAASFFLFFSCSQLGIVSKIDRINSFISDLNSSAGLQADADNIIKNISDRKSTRLNSSHTDIARMPSSA